MKAAACIYVRNERHDILEWILHHIAIGFDTVLLMDNNSEDGTLDVATSAARLHDVRVGTWTETGSVSQRRCYDHLLQKYGREFDWMAFIDADEFILPLRDHSIKTFLATVSDHAAVALNWAIFGTSGHVGPPSGLVLENFLRRAHDEFLSNRHVKSIVRPSLTAGAVNPHMFNLHGQRIDEKGRFRSDYVDANAQTVIWSEQQGIIAGDPDLSICRVNHYYTRSQYHFDEKERRKTWRDPESALEQFEYNDRNDIRDTSATSFANAVNALADQIRPRPRFVPSQYGALPEVPFGNRRHR